MLTFNNKLQGVCMEKDYYGRVIKKTTFKSLCTYPECDKYESSGNGYNDFCKHLCCINCGSKPILTNNEHPDTEWFKNMQSFKSCELKK